MYKLIQLFQMRLQNGKNKIKNVVGNKLLCYNCTKMYAYIIKSEL